MKEHKTSQEQRIKLIEESNERIIKLKSEITREYLKLKQIRNLQTSYEYKIRNKSKRKCVDCGDKLRKEDKGIRCPFCSKSHRNSDRRWRATQKSR